MSRQWSLRTRFVLAAVICLLPLLAAFIYLLNSSVDRGRERVIITERAVGLSISRGVSATLGDTQAVLTTLSQDDRIRNLVPEDAQTTLREAQHYRVNLSGFFLLRPDGTKIASVGADPDLFRADLSTAVTSASAIGTGVTRRVSIDNTDVVAIVVPVYVAPAAVTDAEASTTVGEATPPAAGTDEAVAGQAVAVLGAFLPVERIRQGVLPLDVNDTTIAVVGRSQVIVQTADVDDSGRSFASQLGEEIEAAIGGRTGSVTYDDASGTERLAVYTPVPFPGANWAVIVSNPAPRGYSVDSSLFTQGLVALVLAVLATLVLAFVLGERVARPLRRLTAQAAQMADGQFSPTMATVETPESSSGVREVSALGSAFREMASRIIDQMHLLESARADRAHQADELRELLRRTVRFQEDERRRIAGEIHDAVSPLITGALYQVRALVLSNGGTNPAERDAGLAAVGNLLEQAFGELHDVIFALRPPDLDDIGVTAAIERFAEQIQHPGLSIRLDVVGDPQPAHTPEVRLGIYRIVQEALHNVVRHSGADEVLVRFETTNDLLRVTVRDNGGGFDPQEPRQATSLGLLSMRERAAAIGATLYIHSQPGGGTAVVIERPHLAVDRDSVALQSDRWLGGLDGAIEPPATSPERDTLSGQVTSMTRIESRW